jgi:hypothetical protein
LKSFVSGIDFETHKYKPSVLNSYSLDHSGGIWGDDDDNFISFLEGNVLDDNEDFMNNMEIFIMQNDNSGISQKSDRGFGWLHNKNYNWKTETGGMDTVNNACFGPINPWQNSFNVNLIQSQKYMLNGFKQGEYIINIFDTKTGAQIGGDISAHANFANQLKFKIPFITLNENTPDIAFKFRHQDLANNSLRHADLNDSYKLEGANNDMDTTFSHNIQVFPNPSSEEIFIVNPTNQKLNLKIINQLGEIVMDGSLLQSNRINIKSLSVGVYFLSLTNDFVNSTHQLIKQ